MQQHHIENIKHIEHFEHNEHLENIEHFEHLEHLDNLEHFERIEHIEHFEHLESSIRLSNYAMNTGFTRKLQKLLIIASSRLLVLFVIPYSIHTL